MPLQLEKQLTIISSDSNHLSVYDVYRYMSNFNNLI